MLGLMIEPHDGRRLTIDSRQRAIGNIMLDPRSDKRNPAEAGSPCSRDQRSDSAGMRLAGRVTPQWWEAAVDVVSTDHYLVIAHMPGRKAASIPQRSKLKSASRMLGRLLRISWFGVAHRARISSWRKFGCQYVDPEIKTARRNEKGRPKGGPLNANRAARQQPANATSVRSAPVWAVEDHQLASG